MVKLAGTKVSEVLLKELDRHEVSYVFGLPGETTLPLYETWSEFNGVKHVLTRDERSAVFMADAYARLSSSPGVCEAPSVGATHLVPGVVEAYKASSPLIIFTSDIPLHLRKRNMLTGFDQTALFKGITKETHTITNKNEMPQVIRRAFRVSTTGRPGPVHIRIPKNVFSRKVNEFTSSGEVYSTYPGQRTTAEKNKMSEALKHIVKSKKPIFICGQGTLYSQAWNEVTELAELLSVPVGTTMTGKGSIDENHPLSIGVIGSRGGTSFSNNILESSDLIFYIGSNTDSAGTNYWKLPRVNTEKTIIQLDISEEEVGNNYPIAVGLVGDVKATLTEMIDKAKSRFSLKQNFTDNSRIREIKEKRKLFWAKVKDKMGSDDTPVHPLRFLKEFSSTVPQKHVIVADPGVSAIYLSAFYRIQQGRTTVFNYALGALGYALPAAVGARHARPESCIVALIGDGSFGFSSGELETISRVGGNVNVILFNNGTFGWIRGAYRFESRNTQYFQTRFSETDYLQIASGYGISTYQITSSDELKETLKSAFQSDKPSFIDMRVKSEEELVPPVPSWIKRAKEENVDHFY